LTELSPIIASIEALAGELACAHIADPQIAAIAGASLPSLAVQTTMHRR
jgi:hypothetical protein